MTLAVSVSGLGLQVFLRVLTRFNSVRVRETHVRMIIIGPSNLRYRVALGGLINVDARGDGGLVLLNYRLNLLVASNGRLLLYVRNGLASIMRNEFLNLLTACATGSDLCARRRLLRERELNSVVIDACLRTFRGVLLRDLNDGRCS